MSIDSTKENKSLSEISNNNIKILIECMHGMGDLVCILPLIKEVRDSYPRAYITVLINNSSFVDILECSNIKIDRIISINAHKNLIKFIKLCFELRQERYDIAISSSCTSPIKAKSVMTLINAKEKFGYQFEKKEYGNLDKSYHFVEANNLVLSEMGITNHYLNPRLYAKDNDLKKFYIKRDKPVVGVCIGRADPSFKNRFLRTNLVYTRGWGDFSQHIVNMNSLIKRLLDEGNTVILLGSKREIDILNALSKEILLSVNCYNFVDKTSISESIALVKQCDVVVGVDTGMQHVSDAVGTRTVSIFGPTNPKTHGAYSELSEFVEYHVPCKYCYCSSNYVNCKDRKCMSLITLEMVFEGVNKQLGRMKLH